MTSRMVPRLRFRGFNKEWKTKILGNIVNVFDGTHQTPKYENKGVPFVSVENIDTLETNKYISREAFDKRFKNNKPQKGDVLMSRIGSIGEDNIVPTNKPLSYYVSLAMFRPNLKFLKSLFLMYLIKTPYFQRGLWKRTLHVAFPQKINKGDIPEIPILLSSLSEQHQIGTFFAKLDHLISLQRQKIALLKKLKRGYLQKMFPRKGESVPRLRFKGFSEGWKERKLSSVCSINMGQSPLSKNYTTNPNDNLLVQGNADISNGRIKPRLYTTQITKESKKNDIILTVRAPVGAVAINNYGNLVIGRGVASIKGNHFLYSFFQRMNLMKEWYRYSTGSTFNSINSKTIKNIRIRFPSLSEQQKIGHFFARLDDMISTQINKLNNLKQLKKSYLQKMFC